MRDSNISEHVQEENEDFGMIAEYGQERIPERSSHNILPMEGLAGKITSSLRESNFACYNCINGITSTADEYNSTS